MARCALVTGATGQDGAYLIELLLAAGEAHSVRALVKRTFAKVERDAHALGRCLHHAAE
jgi:GDP-D-mannose dehydratase